MANISLPELSVMQTIAEATDGLTPAEKRRLAAWFMEYALQDDEVQVVEVAPISYDEEEAYEYDDEESFDEAEEEPVAAGAGIDAYDSFATFYDAIEPKSGAQKAVVAGYWMENKDGKDSWKASEVNKLLKSIGVKVSSISIVLSNAVKSKKTMVEELERLGSSERSRKTFRLNDAGVAFVEDRLA